MLKSQKLQRLLTVLTTWVVLLIIFLGYERYFVKGQKEFVRESNFRALSALSRELGSKFDKAQKATESFVKVASERSLSDKESSGLIWYLDHYVGLSDKPSATKATSTARDCWVTGEHKVLLEVTHDPQALKLSISCFKKPKADDAELPDLASKVPLYDLDLAGPVTIGFERQGDYFDDVLVADSTGQVLFQKSQTGPRIVNLQSFVKSAAQNSKPQQKTESASTVSDEQRKAQEQGQFQAEFVDVGAVTQVTEAGVNYELFTQPARIVLRSATQIGKTWDLIICGLRREDRSEGDAHRLPFSAIIWAAMTAVVLFSLSWPLFKLRYMSNTERFSAKDGWFLIIAMVVVSTTGMLMLLNASYTSWAREADDGHMKAIATQIRTNFTMEMRQALDQLQALREEAVKKTSANLGKQVVISSYLNQSQVFPSKYPFFEIAFWTNEKGKPLLKFDVRPMATPAIDVSPFPFFRKIFSDGNWPSHSPSDGRDASSNANEKKTRGFGGVYLQPVLSPSTDEFSALLAAPVVSRPTLQSKTEREPQDALQLQALTMRPMSLVDPVLPPGYGFAVIDEKCNVLFHSQSFRNMRENFCQESKDPAELFPWILSGVDSSIDISYSGQPERAFLTSLKDGPQFATGPAFLIVFRQPQAQLTLNLAVILVCSILLGAYFTVLLLAAAVHLSLRGPLHLLYAPDFMWPRPESALVYLAVFAANGFMLAVYWVVYQRLFEGPLLTLTFATAAFSVVFSILKLRSQQLVLFRLGTILVLAGGLGVSIWIWRSIRGTAEREPQWVWVFAAIGAFGLIAILLTWTSAWNRPFFREDFGGSSRIRHFAKKHFTMAFSLAGLSLITLVGLVPCIGSFKYSYDAVSELSLKHDELTVSNNLVARRDRIRKYYDTVATSAITQAKVSKAAQIAAQKRIEQPLDRYDNLTFDGSHIKPVFATTSQPTLSGTADISTGAANCGSEDKQSGSKKVDVNGWLEKQIARATLQFPSNQLGREMSRLGVASTEDADTAWEHCWFEPKPWQFQLTWKSDSKIPGFTVSAEYPQWQGLKPSAAAWLVLLSTILALWIMNLARKIFFTDIDTAEPFPAVDWANGDPPGRDFLVIGLAKSGKSEWLRTALGVKAKAVLDMRVELRKMVDDPKYRTARPQTSLVVLDHFDFNLRDAGYNMARLNLLENLICETACKVIAVSTVDPLYFLTEESPDVLCEDKGPASARKLLERWALVLSKFKKVRPKDSQEREFESVITNFVKDHPDQCKFAIWISRECNCTAMLRRIGKEILHGFAENEAISYERVVSNVLDRADTYYHVLWLGLTTSERLVLYQLALDGWANAKNTAAIQQLERKQLIYKAPMYRIMNESFRRFIAGTEHADEMAQWQSSEQQSTWRAFRVVLIAAAIGAGVWLLYTQAALSQVVAGYIAAVATLLTAVASLFARSSSAKMAPSDNRSE